MAERRHSMCNVYSLTKGQVALCAVFRVTRDLSGNLPPLPDFFPDAMAPAIRSPQFRWQMLPVAAKDGPALRTSGFTPISKHRGAG
jgi:hypothetical protein